MQFYLGPFLPNTAYMPKFILYCAVLAMCSPAYAESPAHLLWKARALEAENHVNYFFSAKTKTPEELSDEAMCRIYLETDLKILGDEKSPLFFKSNDGRESIMLALAQGKAKIVLSFSYKTKSTTPFQISALQMDEGWGLTMMPGSPGFVLQNEKCIYEFKPADYLHPKVSAAPKH